MNNIIFFLLCAFAYVQVVPSQVVSRYFIDGAYNHFRGAVPLENGNYFIVSRLNNGSAAFCGEVSTSGTIVWSRNYGSNTDNYTTSGVGNIAKLADNTFVIACQMASDEIDTAYRGSYAFALHIDRSGTILDTLFGDYYNYMDSSTAVFEAKEVCSTRDGGFILAGKYRQALHNEEKFHIRKYSATCKELWRKDYECLDCGYKFTSNLTVDFENNLYFAGSAFYDYDSTINIVKIITKISPDASIVYQKEVDLPYYITSTVLHQSKLLTQNANIVQWCNLDDGNVVESDTLRWIDTAARISVSKVAIKNDSTLYILGDWETSDRYTTQQFTAEYTRNRKLYNYTFFGGRDDNFSSCAVNKNEDILCIGSRSSLGVPYTQGIFALVRDTTTRVVTSVNEEQGNTEATGFHPQPSDDRSRIEVFRPEAGAGHLWTRSTVRCLTAIGEEVSVPYEWTENGKLEIETSGLPSGLYYVQVLPTDEKARTYSLVVRH